MYNPMQMPCDWNVARKHALSRRTAPSYKNDDEDAPNGDTCPCCGFEIERCEIPYCEETKALKFLGAGFPLFYNFLKFCILILTFQSVSATINLITNSQGNHCKTEGQIQNGEIGIVCMKSIFLSLSAANSLNNQSQIKVMQKLDLLFIPMLMIFLSIFRRQQKKLDNSIDESQLTPSDYTIMVSNIPKNLPVNYRWELTNIFQNYAVQDSSVDIRVSKIVLVYKTDEIENVHKQIAALIEKKKVVLKRTKNNYQNLEVMEIDNEIKVLQGTISEFEDEYFYTNKKFAGIAFVSFSREDMKDMVLSQNKHTYFQRIKSFLYNNKMPDLSEDVLQWHDQMLFLDPAPEPNDIDWNNIHIPTVDKFIYRVISFILNLIFRVIFIVIIYYITSRFVVKSKQLYQEELNGGLDSNSIHKVLIYSIGLTLSIILINNVMVDWVLTKLVKFEKYSTFTKFSIQLAHKLIISSFINVTLITYIINYVVFNNLYGYGGFIYNETLIFVLNSFVPIILWSVDPQTHIKSFMRDLEVEKSTDSLFTQQEANDIMEQVPYQPGTRYSDTIKTMWLSFFFGTIIPIGVIVQLIGLIIYYFIDKYNLLRRRTVKESISKELSFSMVEQLELIIILGPIGNLIMRYSFTQSVSFMDVLQLMIGMLYLVLPIQALIEFIFPVKSWEDPVEYEKVYLKFETDYDRENPVTKSNALLEFKELLNIDQGFLVLN